MAAEIKTIEQFLKSRRYEPVFTLALAKDMARRIRDLERKLALLWMEKA